MNFGVANLGGWAVCTNEGNGRYVTGFPKTYVAIMGMERIVRDAGSAAVILKLLARFATGQRITQYVNFAFGPGPAAGEGPERIHLVIVDNGRRRILGTPYRDMLRCIRCGACLNVCPVFRRVGGQPFPGCYSGPMGTVLLPLQQGLKAAGAPLKACSLCGLCSETCPVKIPLKELILELRADLAESGIGTRSEKLAMGLGARIFEKPGRYRLARKTARRVMSPLSRDGWISWLPGWPGRWTRCRDLPLPARRSFLEGGGREGIRDAEPSGASGTATPDASAHEAASGIGSRDQRTLENIDPGSARLVSSDASREERTALFMERAEASGAEVHRVASRAETETLLAELLPEGCRVGLAIDGVKRSLSLDFPEGRILLDVRDLTRDELFTVDVAVTRAARAVAETGSVWLEASTCRARAVSLTADLHVVLLDAEKIVPDLADWAEALDRDAPEGGATLITGPSKTADIELTLVKGVHGPARVVVIIK